MEDYWNEESMKDEIQEALNSISEAQDQILNESNDEIISNTILKNILTVKHLNGKSYL